MLHVGFICFNLCCMRELFVLIYLGIFNLSSFSIVLFFYFHICRLIKILYKLTMFMYCPDRSVSAF